jgi:hypothetical protein
MPTRARIDSSGPADGNGSLNLLASADIGGVFCWALAWRWLCVLYKGRLGVV